jgi:Fe-S-cluster containining protein
MDIPLEMPIALFLVAKGEEIGLNDLIVREHPLFLERAIVCKETTKGDITTQDCVFFIGGRCSIYEHRPDICRIYGTEYIRCRYECSEINNQYTIASLDKKTIQELDNISISKSKIGNYINHIRISK